DCYHKDMVSRLLRRYAPEPSRRRKGHRAGLQKDEWFVSDLAAAVGIPKNTLYAWVQRGWVSHRKPAGTQLTYVCWADAAERRRLRQLWRTPHGWWDPPLAAELTTPRSRPQQ